jgi:hypothetical protein
LAVRIPVFIASEAIVVLLMVWASQPTAQLSSALACVSAGVLGVGLGCVVELLYGRRSPRLIRNQWRDVEFVGAQHDSTRVEFDIRPLTAKVPYRDRRQTRARIPRAPYHYVMLLYKWLFLIGGSVILLIIPAAFTDEEYVKGPEAAATITNMALFFSLLILAYIIFGVVGMRGMQQATSAADQARLVSFAEANGFRYNPGPTGSTDGSVVTRLVSAPDAWQFGNAMQPDDQPPESVAPITKFYGFAEYQLPVELPHIFMSRRGFRPPAFSSYRAPLRSQRLSLEGDFDRYFTTYCPKGYERDALYLLTPDVMIALIDGARNFDVEILGNRLILRSRKDLVTIDPAVWQTIARAISALAGRANQWKLWHDDRRDLERDTSARLEAEKPSGVALAGRYLRGGLSFGAILIGGYGATFVTLTWIVNAL